MNPSTIMGYAAPAKGKPLELFTYAEPELEDQEVRVAITHCVHCFHGVSLKLH